MLIIRGADIYAPDHIGIRDVMVCGGKIELIRERIEVPADFPNCREIDGSGLIMTPGLIDQHVHITGGGGEGSFHTRVPEAKLSDFVNGGVTTVVGLLGTDGITRSVENLTAKAKALKEEGMTAYALTGSYGYPSPTITGDVKKDIVFIDEILGLKLAISDHRAPNIPTDELIRTASDVRTAGMVSGKPGILVLHMGDDKAGLQPVFDALEKTSIPIKTFRPTHVSRNHNLLLQAFRFAKMGGYIDLTCDNEEDKEVAEALLLAKQEGVPLDRITMSSDGQGSFSSYDSQGNLTKMGVSSLSAMLHQLKDLIENHGYSMEEILPHMTSYVARALELYPKKGCIEEGADGDILLMEKNCSLHTVIAMGKIMMNEGNIVVKGTYED
ncbi:beta-aspartyl-peptidase [Clostridium sp. AM58-1XD]|uniref:beta-aspartyl-peptidase n=1 Tax=Clostridium sp. AM58-1XD TaxID=2292307 RepID=UPI000E4C025D|nr:beta-aspartyl-peptidase [Clostridium sp. AM58-1XD]RGY98520.1 beta-aspartyl-peptidase [Clostridium sp. AM58-1XD]